MLAHRAVLACCSPYLFEIFNSDSDPHGVSHVKLDDLNPEAVEVLLNYAYTAQWVPSDGPEKSENSKILNFKALVLQLLFKDFFCF